MRWRGKEARPRGEDWGPPQGVVGSGSAPDEATQSHSPAARRPPRPGDGPGARGGCGGPSAAETPALASTPPASASVYLRRPPSARTRPLLTSPRGLGWRQEQGVEIPPPSALRTRRSIKYNPHTQEPGAGAGTAHAPGHFPAPPGALNSCTPEGCRLQCARG